MYKIQEFCIFLLDSVRNVVVPSKISFFWSICSFVLRWHKCCGVRLRPCVEDTSNIAIISGLQVFQSWSSFSGHNRETFFYQMTALALASVIPRKFFAIRSQIAFCADTIMLPRFCSCPLASKQNILHVAYFPSCALVLTKSITK